MPQLLYQLASNQLIKNRVMRIVSLVPSASEMICDLGLKNYLVGISHECNYPPDLDKIDSVTLSNINSDKTQLEIDNEVRKKVDENLPLYEVEIDKINELKPDIIVTQGICDVCAISSSEVEVLLRGQLCTLPSSTKIISLNGRSFNEICDDILMLGKILNKEKKSKQIVKNAKAEKNKISNMKKFDIRVLCLEWVDPYFSAGHWVPEQIEMAGFISAIGNPGDQSRVIKVEEIIDSNPDVVAIICCGYNEVENRNHAKKVIEDNRINHLPPFKNDKVFSFDSDGLFSRPTLRIIQGAKKLRETILLNYL